ncbi:MAG: hypothetical protein US86_C0002G0098 [Candidatus Daviesbacteria bacterium GW2011_GWA2_38_24]|uniref:PhnB-like domain-containing protein n=1 Tax=Candidatus Daviesbacteria bacterium GW2011_GWA2_38_24 TaxID=1618422 RepID=A0A0G0MPW1_9BACT|nr:MAG: hypothetical protein US86_C0002G0098 [Candidatus Daviesbacteria bacterium GW2011_GWA2_38_24]KKQ80741.1 MAG: hypothetical protein UT01_C0006G0002 [Candidatus Daviesbacteria bacterium GW2011_GWA1_38_7]
MAQLRPYLHFDGTAREAMNFYKEILGGELELQTVGETPWASEMPNIDKIPKERIMHSTLTKDGWVLMASDMMMPESFTKGDTVSICLVCESKEEIEDLYNKLSAGGDVFMKLEETPFGTFAMVTDKFGTEWMLQLP